MRAKAITIRKRERERELKGAKIISEMLLSPHVKIKIIELNPFSENFDANFLKQTKP